MDPDREGCRRENRVGRQLNIVTGKGRDPADYGMMGRLVQADAYAGYDRLYDAGRRPGPIVEVTCWAHARRKFFDLARLNKAPIAIERDIVGLPPGTRWPSSSTTGACA